MSDIGKDEYSDLPRRTMQTFLAYIDPDYPIENYISRRDWTKIVDPFKLSATLILIVFVFENIIGMKFWNIVNNNDVKVVVVYISCLVFIVNIIVWPICNDKSLKSYWICCLSCLRIISCCIFVLQLFIIISNIILSFFDLDSGIPFYIFVFMSLFYISIYVQAIQSIENCIMAERVEGDRDFSKNKSDDLNGFFIFISILVTAIYFYYFSHQKALDQIYRFFSNIKAALSD